MKVTGIARHRARDEARRIAANIGKLPDDSVVTIHGVVTLRV
jgi:hypothetical protein